MKCQFLVHGGSALKYIVCLCQNRSEVSVIWMLPADGTRWTDAKSVGFSAQRTKICRF